jgi:amino acid transporter
MERSETATAAGAGQGEELLREFNVWSTFALAFAFISPIVALYGIFGIGLATVGPGFWWGFPITLGGQLLVALTFAQLASRWPIEGSVYQWSRRLIGPGFGWAAGWAYIWTLVIAVAAVAYGAAGFVAQIFGITASTRNLVLVSIVTLALVTWGNTHGRHVLKIMVGLCIAVEIIGSIGIGAVLLIFYRENSVSVLFNGLDAPSSSIFTAPLVLGVAYAGWSFLGFESAGAIAEEVRDPKRSIPKAMVASLAFVAAVVMFSSFALILAIPDLAGVASGAVADPVVDTLTVHFGSTVVKGVLVLFLIGFFAALLAIQAAASRVIWAFARESELPASRHLAKLSGPDRMPVNAVLVTTVMSGAIYVFSGSNIYTLLVTFTSGGFYVAFAFPVVALAVARLRGRWEPGTFTAGRYGAVVSWAALIWLLAEIAIIVWPRYPELSWHDNYAFFVIAAAIAAVGLVIRLSLRETGPAVSVTPDRSTVQPIGDPQT